MPNVFLNYGGSSSTALDPNSALKTDSAGNITASELAVSDTTGLQGLLDGKLPEPLPRAAANDGRYLKYVHGSTPIWDTPAGGSGGSSTFTGLSDTPGSYTANQAVRVNAAGSGLEFYNQSIGEETGGISGVISLRSTGNSITNPELKVLKAGSNVTLSNPEDPNVIQINSTGQIDDASASASTTYSSSKINTELATKAPVSHTHAISDVVSLQSSLDAKLNSSQVVNSASTTAGQAYDVRYVDAQLSMKAAASHTHAISEVTNLQSSLDSKLDSTRIQTAAEGDSTSETDTYSCNSVYSKNQINTSVTSQEITVNHQSTAGRLNFGSNLTSGLYGSLQTYANSTRYSAMHHYATSGNCNLEWYLMKNNGLTKLITVRPSDSEKVFEVLDGGIKAPIFQQRDSTTLIKIGRMDSASIGVPGVAIIPLVNTVHSEFQMRGLRNTGILADSYVYHQNGSSLTIQSRIQTNRHSSTHANIEISTYQAGSETKVMDIGSDGTSKTVTVHGTLHATSHITTGASTFNANDQLISKQYADSVADGSLTGASMSGNDMVFTRKNQSNILVQNVKSPQLSFAVQGGTVSNNGATLQLTQTNGTPAAITGLTPSTIADGKTLASGAYDLGAGSLSITQQDTTSITITGCPRPLSSFSAGAGSGNYYTPSFLNDRILPAVSSAVNTRLLGNDGTGPLWIDTITASSGTINMGSSTVKKFFTWLTGKPQEYYMRASPSNGDNLGEIVFSDTLFNNYCTIVGKVDDNSTRAGHVSISTAWNNTMAETLLIGKSDHSGSDAGQFKGVLKADGIKFSSNLTQTKPVEDPSTVGHVLTATSGGNWQWAAPTGGGGGSIGPTYIDIHCQVGVSTPSGSTAITTGASGSEALTTRWGVSWGKRYKTMFISQSGAPGWCYDGQDTLRADNWPRDGWGDHIQSMFNGNYTYNASGSSTGPLEDDDFPPSFFVRYGYFDFRAPAQYRYNFSKLALYWNGTPSSSGSDYFKIWGSNDGVEFTELLHTTLQSGTTTTPSGYSVSQASGSASTVRWYNFTTTGFYRIYRHQWGEATNLDVLNSTTSAPHIFRFLTYSTQATKVSLMEFEYH